MKTRHVLSALLLTLSLYACSSNITRLSETEIEQTEVEKALTFANRYMEAQVKGSWYRFSDEATPEMINLLSETTQKNVAQSVQQQFGHFESLEFAEAWAQQDALLTVYRFKAQFSQSNKKVELRVVLDQNEKIAGFWIKPWMDVLQ